MCPAAKPFSYRVSVRFSDLDPLGHVNNTRYLTYVEDARIAFFRHLGISAGSTMPSTRVIARTAIDYFVPIGSEDGPIDIVITVVRVGSRSFTLNHDFVCVGRLCARAEAVLVGFDLGRGESRPLDEDERTALAPLVVEPSAAR